MCHCYGIDMAIDRTETAAMAVVLICNDRLPGARSDIGRTWINELDYICRTTVYTDVTSIAKTPIYKFNHLDASSLDFRLIRHQTYRLAEFDLICQDSFLVFSKECWGLSLMILLFVSYSLYIYQGSLIYISSLTLLIEYPRLIQD